MPPPSSLSIATSSVSRLVKEEASYQAELAKQEERLQKALENPDPGDENAEYTLKQERQAMEETRAVFPSLRKRIADALQKLQDQLDEGAGSTEEEVQRAREVLAAAKERRS